MLPPSKRRGYEEQDDHNQAQPQHQQKNRLQAEALSKHSPYAAGKGSYPEAHGIVDAVNHTASHSMRGFRYQGVLKRLETEDQKYRACGHQNQEDALCEVESQGEQGEQNEDQEQVSLNPACAGARRLL